MDKSLLIVIDQFSDRVLLNNNVTLFDYGKIEKVAYIDNYYNVYNGAFSGYGNYDDLLITEDGGYGFFPVTKDDTQYSYNFDLDYINRTSFIDRFGFTAYADNFLRFSRTDQTSEVSANHGDWVIEAILQTLDRPQYTEIICIDVDTLNGEFSHFDNVFDQTIVYFNGTSSIGSYLEQILSTFIAVRDSRFNPSGTANYAIGGISLSIGGALPDINEAIFLNFLETIKVPIFQAAPNVNQGYFDYAMVFPNVITVGAWNKTNTNNLLLGSDSTIGTIDILADGSVEKSGWGTNFGTSFATPKVAAEFFNLLNNAIVSLNNSGMDLTDIDTPNIDGIVYSDLVKSIVEKLSTDVIATINGQVIGKIPVLSSTIENNGFMPKTINGVSGSSLVITSAAADVTQTNRSPTGTVTITGTPTQGQTLTASHSLADADGLGAITYTWKAGGAMVSTGATYTLTQADVGKTMTVTANYTDGGNSAEAVTSAATTMVANINDAPTGSVGITGTAAVGQTLTASITLTDPDGLGAITYTWKAGATTLGTGNSYTLTQAEVGKTITVTASYTDGGNAAESVTSAATVAVANVDDESTGTLGVSGNVKEGSVLTASLSNVVDADGATITAYQWQQLVSGAWSDLSSGKGSTFFIPSDGSLAGKSMRVIGTTTDTLGGTTQFVSETLVVQATSVPVNVEVRAWKTSDALSNVEVSFGSAEQTTDAAGMARFTSIVEPSMAVSATVSPTSPAYSGSSQTVTLQDAVSILKMIAGQPAGATPVSRLQSLAADFDGSGTVSLADALGVLRHAVGLQAPTPSWVFVKEGDDALPSILSPGIPGPVTVDMTPPGPIEVNLIGVLRGDVDGSYGVYQG
jgi:hypothetical protein